MPQDEIQIRRDGGHMAENHVRCARNKEEKDGRQDGLRKVFADMVKGEVVKRADAVIIIGNAAVQRIHDDMQNGGIENQRGEDAAACRESGEKGVLRLCAVKGSEDGRECIINLILDAQR